MATSTPNLSLRKPDPADHVSVATDLNANWDKVDAHVTSAAAHTGTYVGLASVWIDATLPPYSVDKTGVTDVVANGLQAACTAAAANVVAGTGPTTVYLPAGSYLFASQLDKGAGVTLKGAGRSATKLVQGFNTQFFFLVQVQGTSASSNTTALTAQANPGDTTLTLASTTGITVDSYWTLGNDVAIPGSSGGGYVGEIVHVKTVDSATQVTLWGVVRDTYTVANAGGIQATTLADAGAIEDLTIINNAPGTTLTNFVRFLYCKDVAVRRCHMEGGDGRGVQIEHCVGGGVADNSFFNFSNDTAGSRFGYCVDLMRGTENIRVVNNSFRRQRHSVTTNGSNLRRGQPRNIVIAHNVVSEGLNAGIDTHSDGSAILISSNTIVNCQHAGIQVRSQDTRVIGNSVSWCAYGIWFSQTAHGSEARGNIVRHIIKTPVEGGLGLLIGSSNNGAQDHITVAGNTIESCARAAIMVDAASPNLQIHDNRLYNWAQDDTSTYPNGIHFTATVTAMAGFRIEGNKFGTYSSVSDDEKGIATTAAYCVSVPSQVTGGVIANNSCMGTVAGLISDAGGNTAFHNYRVDQSPSDVFTTTVPSTSGMANSTLAAYLDLTPGAPKIQFKAKDSGGAIRTTSLTLPTIGTVALPGTTGNYFSTPDAADISIGGDLTLLAKVAPADWTPSANKMLIAKYSGSSTISYALRLGTDGKLTLLLSSNGTAFDISGANSSVAASAADGTILWVLATRQQSTGTIRYYTSPDGLTWTQLGIDRTGTTGTIFDSTSPLELGSRGGGATENFVGDYYYAEVRNAFGTAGALGSGVAWFDADAVNGTPASRTPATAAQSGRTWTGNGSTWTWEER
jgi:hypothetical protein